ncbi:MAG TPA: glycosyltransferase [Candidatus Limnocylindrales bacterium]|nr:glycosyltransferase [Candidatus Limnocylindrales bacterium]
MTAGRPIRVAFLTPSLHPGGAERQMLLLAATLPRPEFEVRFILLWERGPWAAQAEALGIPIDVLGLRPQDLARPRPGSIVAALRAVRRYLVLARRVDIVDAWLVPSYTFAGFVQPLARVPALIAGRRSLLGLYRKKPWIRRAAAGWATRLTRAVVANSRAAGEEAVAIEHVPAARVHVIPNAVVPAVLAAGERERRRTAWGVAPDAIVVGCVANYKPGKGLERVVEAAGALRSEVPELRFVLVGEGPFRERLEAEIRERGLESVVILNGTEADARSVYPAFDIVVQASDSEGLPNVVLEAASAGRAIVATDVGGTSDVLTDGVNGILVAPGDAVALGRGILRLAGDPALRDRLGHAALERAGEFSPEHLAAQTADLYRQLLQGRKRRP